MKRLVVLLVVFFSCVASANEEGLKKYKLYLSKAIYDDYNEMLGDRDPLAIEDISQVADKRMLVEPLIMQVAPVLGGCNCRIEYDVYNVALTAFARSVVQVKNGWQISHGIAGFSSDEIFDDASIALSNPIVESQDMHVGIYTHEDREDVLSLTSDEDIRNLRFAVGVNWSVDMEVLNSYNMKSVPTDTWQSLIQVVAIGRADAILQPFYPSDDLSFTDSVSQLKFKPIPNVKILFGKSRNYFVSMKHPDGPGFLKALNKGLDVLKGEGKLMRAMQNAGVINKAVEGFREMKP